MREEEGGTLPVAYLVSETRLRVPIWMIFVEIFQRGHSSPPFSWQICQKKKMELKKKFFLGVLLEVLADLKKS